MKAYTAPTLATNGSMVRETLAGPIKWSWYELPNVHRPFSAGSVGFYL